MHCGLLAGSRHTHVWTPTQVLWIHAIIQLAGQSDAFSHYHMWPGKLSAFQYCLVCITVYVCI